MINSLVKYFKQFIAYENTDDSAKRSSNDGNPQKEKLKQKEKNKFGFFYNVKNNMGKIKSRF